MVQSLDETCDIVAHRLVRRVLGSLANEYYLNDVAREQYKWLLELENIHPSDILAQHLISHMECLNLDGTVGCCDEYEFVIESPPDTTVRKCICTNVMSKHKVCLREKCTFAHSLDEWQPEPCKYGKKCRTMASCQRLHGRADTKEAALKRLGIEFLSPKKYAKTKMYIKNFKQAR